MENRNTAVYTAWKTETPLFTPHGKQKHRCLHRMENRNTAVYTAWKTETPLFTPHGKQKHRCLHRMENRNTAVYTAWSTIASFTPGGLTKIIFHLHRMVITKLLHITSPFTPHGIQKLLRLHRTEYNLYPLTRCMVNTTVPPPLHGLVKCSIFCPTTWVNPTSPFTHHGIQKLLVTVVFVLCNITCRFHKS